MTHHALPTVVCRAVLTSAAMLVACASAAAAEPPQADGNGVIHQGPYLLCGDNECMLHLLYQRRPLIREMGVFCGLNGYTRPRDLAEKQATRGSGGVTVSGKVRGHDVAFELTAAPAGERIRIRVRRAGPWPEGVWGGLQMPLPVSRYAGAQYRADGQALTWPAEYSPDNEFAAGARRLECHLGRPELDVTFECAEGLSIDDHRRFQAPYFIVGVGVPTGEAQTRDVFITLPEFPGAEQHVAVRWSHIGYPLRGEKFAVLEWSKYGPRPADQARLEDTDGNVVKQGRFGPTQVLDYMQGSYAEFDFSDVIVPGRYRVVWDGGATGYFPIMDNVFTDALWQPTLDDFIPFQMCHANVELGEGITGHPPCHMDDAARVAAHFRGPDGFVSYEAEGTPYEAGEQVACALGGWHDAGDYDVNVHANAFTTWTLALAYEEFGIERDVATLDVAAATFAAGRPDGVPDILQQVEWGALWLLSMQQEDGRVYNGVCANEPGRSGELGKIQDGRPGTGDERQLYVDYHADGQLAHAIALAAASRALKGARPELADRCLEAARKSFAYFRTHAPVYRSGGYASGPPHGKEDDAMAIAAAVELYFATGEQQYLAVVQELAGSLRELTFDWPLPRDTGPGGFWLSAPFLARIYPHLPDGEARGIVMEACRRAAGVKAERTGQRPWPFNWWHFGQWGNSMTSTSRAFDAYWLTRVAPDLLPPELVQRNMLWLFGLHPTCDTAFVCGLGLPEPQHLFSGHLHALFGYEPASIPGAVVPGMGGAWQAGVVMYADEKGNYGHNEACIYTAAQYIFAVNAMKSFGY
ncbi:MAG: hypothetical protein AMK73_01085 [Planctomycetes bacterium SM23_32]|nr:MAG: hypothetical protein AMK73_01085 [Planctomycetes bacterium SM23_32]